MKDDFKTITNKHIKTGICDSFGYLKINNMFSLLQEAAEQNIDFFWTKQRVTPTSNLRWMVLDYEAQILKPPRMGDNIQIETWPSGEVALYAIRDFRILEEDGEALVNATSRWVMVDILTKRPVRFMREVGSLPILDIRAINTTFKKIDLSGIDSYDFISDFRTRWIDCDANGHLNNTIYSGLIYDCLGADFLASHILHNIRINFKNGVRVGDEVQVSSKIVADRSYHQFIQKSTGLLAGAIEIVWVDR